MNQQDLEAHLARLEDIKRRDHRKLGKDLDLFSIEEEAGPGLVLSLIHILKAQTIGKLH